LFKQRTLAAVVVEERAKDSRDLLRFRPEACVIRVAIVNKQRDLLPKLAPQVRFRPSDALLRLMRTRSHRVTAFCEQFWGRCLSLEQHCSNSVLS
jgi:hypothetical protein